MVGCRTAAEVAAVAEADSLAAVAEVARVAAVAVIAVDRSEILLPDEAIAWSRSEVSSCQQSAMRGFLEAFLDVDMPGLRMGESDSPWCPPWWIASGQSRIRFGFLSDRVDEV